MTVLSVLVKLLCTRHIDSVVPLVGCLINQPVPESSDFNTSPEALISAGFGAPVSVLSGSKVNVTFGKLVIALGIGGAATLALNSSAKP